MAPPVDTPIPLCPYEYRVALTKVRFIISHYFLLIIQFESLDADLSHYCTRYCRGKYDWGLVS